MPSSLNKQPIRRIQTPPRSLCYLDTREVFYLELNNHPQFTNLKGYSVTIKDNKNMFEETERLVKTNDYNHTSEFYRYDPEDKDGFSLLHIPQYPLLMTQAFIKLLYVPNEYEQQGIATDTLRELKLITDDVNKTAHSKDKYDGRDLSQEYFILRLCPTPFHMNWTFEDTNTLDWTDPDKVTEIMKDDAAEPLDEDLTRMTYLQLEEFYIRNGFVKCPELDLHKWVDEKTNKILSKQTLSQRSIRLGRGSLIYPAENLPIYQAQEW